MTKRPNLNSFIVHTVLVLGVLFACALGGCDSQNLPRETYYEVPLGAIPMTREDAVKFCEDNGGHLAIVSNDTLDTDEAQDECLIGVLEDIGQVGIPTMSISQTNTNCWVDGIGFGAQQGLYQVLNREPTLAGPFFFKPETAMYYPLCEFHGTEH